MIYNLFLNAYTNAPLTNYYSAGSSADYSQRVFAIDWTFLPHDKNFKVSFKFASRAATLTNSDQIYVTANFLPNSTTLSGGSMVQQNNTSLLGLLKVHHQMQICNMSQILMIIYQYIYLGDRIIIF